MDKIIKRLNKLSLPVVILISSLVIGGFYYAGEVNKQKSIERQQQIKIEQEKKEQLDKELKEQEAKTEVKQALNTCLTDAEVNYSDQWFGECKSQDKLTDRCILLHDMTLAEYAKEKNIPDDKIFTVFSDFYKEKDECSCRLPLVNADRITESKNNAKEECFRKYPQK